MSTINNNNNNHPNHINIKRNSFHFTPIVPKRKLSLNNNNSININNENDNLSNVIPFSSSNKRLNINNNNNNNNNNTSTIRTSKNWILPPRPRPGRKTFMSNNTSISSNSSIISSVSSTGSPMSSNSGITMINNNNINNINNINNSNYLKRRNQSLPMNMKKEDDDDDDDSSNELKRQSNYLAFLKFDDDSSTLNLALQDNENDPIIKKENDPIIKKENNNDNDLDLDLDIIGNKKRQHSILSSISSSIPFDHSLTPINSNNYIISTTTTTNNNKRKNKLKRPNSLKLPSQRDISPTDTIVATPTNDLCISINKLQNYNPIDNQNQMFPDFNLDGNYNISSTSLMSSFPPPPPPPPKQPFLTTTTTKSTNNDNNNDDFIERTTNDEIENEIYNNIWKFLPRYNKSLDKINLSNADDSLNNSTESYFYSAPTLEELMDEQDTNFNFTL